MKETQEELIELRGTTKELYEVLGYFKESAQRRLELNLNQKHKRTSSASKSNQLGIPSNKKKDRSSIMVLKKCGILNYNHYLNMLTVHQNLCNHYPIDTLSRKVDDGLKLMGNWKPSYPTHLFIFNDLILIAVKNHHLVVRNLLQGK